jgi:hypothetical protein
VRVDERNSRDVANAQMASAASSQATLIDLTFLILGLNSLIDSGDYQDVSIREVEPHIRSGDLLDWMAERFKGDIDLSLHNAPHNAARKQDIIDGLQEILGGYAGSERRKWGIENSGLCLLLAWTNELISQRRFIDQVPGSDRFVRLDHNSAGYKEADKSLAELADAIKGSNDLVISPEDRIAVLSEVNGIRSMISGVSVRVGAVYTAAKSTLPSLSSEVTSAVIRVLITKAIEGLLRLISGLF